MGARDTAGRKTVLTVGLGLNWGKANHIFWSKIGQGFLEEHCTPPYPNFWRVSQPPGFTFCEMWS